MLTDNRVTTSSAPAAASPRHQGELIVLLSNRPDAYVVRSSIVSVSDTRGYFAVEVTALSNQNLLTRAGYHINAIAAPEYIAADLEEEDWLLQEHTEEDLAPADRLGLGERVRKLIRRRRDIGG
jgi:hypothetical protein